MNNLEVIIDGVKYVPEGTVTVHGVEYTGIEHWLLDIRVNLLDKWAKEAHKHENVPLTDIPELEAIKDEIEESCHFCDKYLGFKYTGNRFRP